MNKTLKKKNKALLDKFGERFEAFRAERRLTRAQLAEKVGLTQDAIFKIERAGQIPRLATLCDIAAGFDLTVGGFLETLEP